MLKSYEMYYKLQLLIVIWLLNYLETFLCNDLSVTSTGPAVMGTPIMFTATLDDGYEELRYFVFSDDTTQKIYREIETFDIVAQTTVVYNFDYFPRQSPYIMSVRVYSSIFGHKAYKIAEGYTLFNLSANLLGDIRIAQNDTSKSVIDKSIVATNKTVNITAELWDPLNYFHKANISCSWTIDNESRKNISMLHYNFTAAKLYNISVVVEANVTVDGKFQRFNGIFQRSVLAKEPLINLMVDGKKVIPRDNDLSLTVTYNGSPRFWYCYLIEKDAKNVTANISCDIFSVHYTEKRHFTVTRYFQTNGSYLLLVNLGNDVSVVSKRVEITVLGIDNQPQLSFVIIPVTSCIAAVFIIIAGIGYHIKHKPNYTIEVADFDFQHQDDLVEKTLLERVRESFTASIKGDLLNACRRGSNYGSYYNDDDLITSNSPQSSNRGES